MLPRIQLQTPEGVKDYLFARDSVTYEAACAAGEITQGMEIVYKRFLVYVLADYVMLVLTPIMPEAPQGFSFTVNGIPMDMPVGQWPGGAQWQQDQT